MGTSTSVCLHNEQSTVRIPRLVKVHRKAIISTLVSEPRVAAGCVFGVALETLREDGQVICGIPLVLRDMVEFLDRKGMHFRGLFRVCGSVVKAKQLRKQWDGGERVCLEEERDVPTVSSLLKLFLRELPDPIVPEANRKQLIQTIAVSADEADMIHSLRADLRCLPKDNFMTLAYIIHFLSRVAAQSQTNHMPVENLATIFGPCIFHVQAGPGMLDEQRVSNVLLLHLLRHHNTLFPSPTKAYGPDRNQGRSCCQGGGVQELESGQRNSSKPDFNTHHPTNLKTP